jgi:hypothetical protein
MSTPPPPPGQPPPYQAPPPGYQQFGMQPAAPQKTNGMSVASMVLSLVNIIPCFWFFPLPALLGVIFGFVGRGQIKKIGGKGAGMAIAGIVIGIIFLIIGIAFWAYIKSFDYCVRDGSSYRCYNTN